MDGSAMGRWPWVAVVLVVGGLAWWAAGSFLEDDGRRDADQEARAERSALDLEPAVSHVRLAEPAALEPEPERVVEVAVERPSTGGQTLGDEALLRGRVVDESGQPIEGATLLLRGWSANSRRELEHGLPDDWEDPTLTTGADGRFALRFAPHPAFQFLLEASAPGCGEESKRWSEFEPGTELDLGDVRLARAATIVGRLVDAEGVPRTGEAWRAVVHRNAATVATGEVDPSDGSFRLDGASAGNLVVELRSEYGDRASAGVQVAPGEERAVDVVFAGELSARDLRITFRMVPFHVLGVGAEYVRLFGPGHESGTSYADFPGAAERSGPAGGMTFPGLEPGVYTVEVDDPRYLRDERSDLAPGESHRFRLVGGATLEVDVVDADGAVVDDWRLHAELVGATWNPREVLLQPEEGAGPGDPRVFEGVPATELVLKVEREGLDPFPFPQVPLVRGERRRLTLVVPEPTRITGVVRHADGRAFEGAKVVLARPAGNEDSDEAQYVDAKTAANAPQFGEQFRVEAADAVTDATGRYELAGFFDGPFVLRASYAGGATPGVSLTLNVGDEDLARDFELAGPGLVEGRLAGLPTNALPPGASLAFAPSPIALEGTKLRYLFEGLREGAYDVAEDGTFRCELAAGRWRPGFSLTRTHGAGSSTTGSFLRIPEGAELTVRSGETTAYDFDVSRLWPGALDVRVSSNGSLAGAQVVAASGGSSVALEREASVRLWPVAPGATRVEVRGGEGTWTWSSPEEVLVEPGATTSVELRVVQIEGTVRFVDRDTGAPLGDTELVLRPSEARGNRAARFRTDAEGRASATLVPGTYHVGRVREWDRRQYPTPPPPRVEERVELVWSQAGPTTTEVSVPPLLPEADPEEGGGEGR